MGNLITAHVTLQEPRANDLASIPKSIGYRIYHHRAALPLFTVLDRNVPWDSRLHSVAIDNYLSFAKTSDLILGQGSFDPPEDEAEWTLLGESSK